MIEKTKESRTFTFAVDEGGDDIGEFLQQGTGLSREAIADAVEKGALWQATRGKPRRLRETAAKSIAGSKLYLYYNPKVLEEVPPTPTLIENLGEYSVWYKPFGLRSQGSRWGDHCTIQRQVRLLLQLPQRAYVVHRLDRAATGLMVLGHQRKIAAKLARMFEKRVVDKRYQAIVHRRFPGEPPERCIQNALDGKAAVSHVRRTDFDRARDRSLVEVRIETGRKHQIRRHLSALDYPVVGDRLYGREGDGENLMLCAVFLGFDCPKTGEKRSFELPEKWRLTLE